MAEPAPFERGESALAVPVPAAEALVSEIRARFDSSAAYGMPAHLTIVYPFLPEKRLSASVLRRLGAECARTPTFEVSFDRVGRFPTVAYLSPEPTIEFYRLTDRLVRRWPEAPPYGGVHENLVYHLTLADEAPPELIERLRKDLQPELPLKTIVDSAELYIFDGRRWQVRARFGFGSASAENN